MYLWLYQGMIEVYLKFKLFKKQWKDENLCQNFDLGKFLTQKLSHKCRQKEKHWKDVKF